MNKTRLNANEDNSWSLSGEDVEDMENFLLGLNFCLEHPYARTEEEIAAAMDDEEAERQKKDQQD